MVDLSFGDLARGNIINKNDHPSVFHRPNREFKSLAIQHLDNKGGVTARKCIEAVNQDSRGGRGNQACIDTTFHHMMQTRTFQLTTGRQSDLLSKCLVCNYDMTR